VVYVLVGLLLTLWDDSPINIPYPIKQSLPSRQEVAVCLSVCMNLCVDELKWVVILSILSHFEICW
jgi:hypothetical protein